MAEKEISRGKRRGAVARYLGLQSQAGLEEVATAAMRVRRDGRDASGLRREEQWQVILDFFDSRRREMQPRVRGWKP